MQRAPQALSHIPLSLYMHVPWCVKKCPYCDFNSHQSPKTGLDEALQTRYFEQLRADFSQQKDYIGTRNLHSIFVGGGTPSLVGAKYYARFFEWLQIHISFEPQIEITLEANPGTLEHEPFAQYLSAGINRLSIGVQSFNAQQLKVLGRIHDPLEARRAIERARQAGFERVNVDLMHGLPEQTRDEALQDLSIAICSGATHISWYQLTIEPNTLFAKQPPRLPQEDILADIQQAGEALLRSHGFIQYEVSAWRLEQPSRHNMNYWNFGDYLAVGAGAHAKATLAPSAQQSVQILRYQRTRLPADYLAYNFLQPMAMQLVAQDEVLFEFMLNALRLKQVVMRDMFEQRTFLSWDAVTEKLARQKAVHLLEWDDKQLQCTPMGYRFLNDVIALFLVDK